MRSCESEGCSVSTGIHEGLTFGQGRLTCNGFWEFPCFTCARDHEVFHPEDGECWPFVGQNFTELYQVNKEICDEEAKFFREFSL